MYRLTIYAVRMICERSLSPVDHISLVYGLSRRVAPSLDTLAHIIGPNQNECYNTLIVICHIFLELTLFRPRSLKGERGPRRPDDWSCVS